jgi:formamidopyrimidine-DNA glycosylase
MPELPEVEVTRQGLLPHIVGRSIVAIHDSNKNLRLPVPKTELHKWVKNSVVRDVCRRAKHLIFFMDSAAMIIHLGMSGKLGIFSADTPPGLHDHLVFHLNNSMEMRYNDPRRFGFIRVLTPELIESNDPFNRIGPEPLPVNTSKKVTHKILHCWQSSFAESHHLLTPSYLKKKAGKRLQPIKNFLMDSHIIAGIGNIYANEILFTSAILPTTPIGSISLKGWDRIYAATKQVLTQAISCGGTTIRDFISSSGQQGYFQLELNVYGRQGESCHNCHESIQKVIIAGRATYFCPHCQR